LTPLMAILATVLTKLKKLFVVLFAVLKRPFCCRRRTRRNSGMILPMTVTTADQQHHQHIPPPVHQWSPQQQHTNSPYMASNAVNYNANSHSNQNTFHSQNIDINTNKSQNTSTGDEPEVEEDFFKDMVPQFRRTKKIVLTTNQSSDNNHQKSNRFGVDTKATIFQSKELGAMDHFEDDVAGSWEDAAATEMWDTDAGLRDLRQQERERRIAEHQRIKAEKEFKRAKQQPKGNLLATKIS